MREPGGLKILLLIFILIYLFICLNVSIYILFTSDLK